MHANAKLSIAGRELLVDRVDHCCPHALEQLGAPAEYADLCRSPETLALLRLWAVDEDAAFAQFAAFADAGGLEPPDVEELQWQGVMGMVEAQTREAATLALEQALESGDRRPATEIVRAVLAEPDPEGEHPTRLLAVQAERIDRWAGWRSSPRRELLEPLLGDLVDAQVPEWPSDDVLDWLLDEARAGLALTERGALGRALCVEVAWRRPGWTCGKPRRSEADVDNLASLHRALRDSGLVRRRARKLFATKRAGELTRGARRVRVLESLLDGDAFLAARDRSGPDGRRWDPHELLDGGDLDPERIFGQSWFHGFDLGAVFVGLMMNSMMLGAVAIGLATTLLGTRPSIAKAMALRMMFGLALELVIVSLIVNQVRRSTRSTPPRPSGAGSPRTR